MVTNAKLILLIEKYKEGDNKSFEIFYNSTYKIVLTTSYKILKDISLAEDITQRVYIKLIENKEIINENKNIVNWLITVSKNMSLNELKKRNREVEFNENTYENEDKKIFTPTLDFMNKVLDEEEIQIVTMILIQGYKRREIASILDMPISTVTWKYKEALKKVKKGEIKNE